MTKRSQIDYDVPIPQLEVAVEIWSYLCYRVNLFELHFYQNLHKGKTENKVIWVGASLCQLSILPSIFNLKISSVPMLCKEGVYNCCFSQNPYGHFLYGKALKEWKRHAQRTYLEGSEKARRAKRMWVLQDLPQRLLIWILTVESWDIRMLESKSEISKSNRLSMFN